MSPAARDRSSSEKHIIQYTTQDAFRASRCVHLCYHVDRISSVWSDGFSDRRGGHADGVGQVARLRLHSDRRGTRPSMSQGTQVIIISGRRCGLFNPNHSAASSRPSAAPASESEPLVSATRSALDLAPCMQAIGATILACHVSEKHKSWMSCGSERQHRRQELWHGTSHAEDFSKTKIGPRRSALARSGSVRLGLGTQKKLVR